MRISDWSSDVCSSDLVGEEEVDVTVRLEFRVGHDAQQAAVPVVVHLTAQVDEGGELAVIEDANQAVLLGDQDAAVGKEDRKSVVSGKRVAVRVDLGGRRIITKKNNKQE